MSTLTQTQSQSATASGGSRLFLAATLAVWFSLVALAIDAGLTQNAPGQPPLPLVAAVAIPLARISQTIRCIGALNLGK